MWLDKTTNNLFVYDLLFESSYLIKDKTLDKFLLNLQQYSICLQPSKNQNLLTMYIIGGRRKLEKSHSLCDSDTHHNASESSHEKIESLSERRVQKETEDEMAGTLNDDDVVRKESGISGFFKGLYNRFFKSAGGSGINTLAQGTSESLVVSESSIGSESCGNSTNLNEFEVEQNVYEVKVRRTRTNLFEFFAES